MKLVVGLGNPGKEYVNTRHNIGFGLLDYISKKDGYSFKFDKKFNCEMFSINIDGEKVLLIKPFSYMNLSGTVVSKIVSFYDIGVSDILVIQDDLDMEFGKIRIVFDSSSGGHNGIKNITPIHRASTINYYYGTPEDAAYTMSDAEEIFDTMEEKNYPKIKEVYDILKDRKIKKKKALSMK